MEIRAAACDLRKDTDIPATTHVQVLNVQCHWGAWRTSSFGPSLLLPGGQRAQGAFLVASWEASEGQRGGEGWGREAGFSFEVCRLPP